MVNLTGGMAQLLAGVERALDSADYQWAAEVADHVLAIEPSHQDGEDDEGARFRSTRADSRSVQTHRNYFLSSALELRRPQSQ